MEVRNCRARSKVRRFANGAFRKLTGSLRQRMLRAGVEWAKLPTIQIRVGTKPVLTLANGASEARWSAGLS